jgi:hypothetical protein
MAKDTPETRGCAAAGAWPWWPLPKSVASTVDTNAGLLLWALIRGAMYPSLAAEFPYPSAAFLYHAVPRVTFKKLTDF